MVRWEPGSADRLREAAMELFVERGYEQTTVAEIAQRAGVTARTFFRHYADKREVLFGGSETLERALLGALETAPAAASPMAVVAVALDAAAGPLGRDHAWSRRRQSVVEANAELRERELIKMARLGGALAGGLRRRGVPDPAATLAAEAGIVVFRVAFERWVADPEPAGLGSLMRETLAALQAVTASEHRSADRADRPTAGR
ncbi:AcrR family transcriptional regulator [Actinoplanes octamycinicus]|uniref:AcrR family transcriptional regulator n=1 Tax=Actinoplanes octamycinicus TaxID=135948 RepID=A0A7W7M7P8_9ACTN|nr:TetR/AcrR family transcriptional regulator [Actinoplanes octamycinicus]MBB4740058.1 AcrR family transcriptional regulator [Actinoplanes octamycinicus]GIE59453.1 TetR family transcriptional regulator [Actinoplanes octamycinicus]